MTTLQHPPPLLRATARRVDVRVLTATSLLGDDNDDPPTLPCCKCEMEEWLQVHDEPTMNDNAMTPAPTAASHCSQGGSAGVNRRVIA